MNCPSDFILLQQVLLLIAWSESIGLLIFQNVQLLLSLIRALHINGIPIRSSGEWVQNLGKLNSHNHYFLNEILNRDAVKP